MRNGFHFALVEHQRCLNQSFAISGRTGIGDAGFCGQSGIDFLNGADAGL